MKLAIFTYERNLGLTDEVMYVDRKLIDTDGIDKVVESIKTFTPDLIIEREFNDGIANYDEIYKELPNIPKALWSIDAHITLAEHVNYAKRFDYVFLAQSWFLPLFIGQVPGRCFFLPLCHTQPLEEYKEFMKKDGTPAFDYTFVGNIRSLHVDRSLYLNRLKRQYSAKFSVITGPYKESLEIIKASKATFNCSLNNDLNFRVWEALAMGTPLLTDWVTDIGLVRKYCKVYRRIDKAPDISFPTAPLPSAIEFITKGHTLTHRYQQMLDMVRIGVQYLYA